MKYKDLNIGGRNYGIYYMEGTVLGKEKHLETKVSGGGGGGATYNGTGGNAPISISSRTIIHDKVYLDLGNGKEQVLEVEDWDIACREGHKMIAVWIIKQGEERGPYIAMANGTTDEVFVSRSSIEKIFGNFWTISIGCMGQVTFAFAAGGIGWFLGQGVSNEVGATLSVVTFIGYFFMRHLEVKKFNSKVDRIFYEVQKFLKEKVQE